MIIHKITTKNIFMRLDFELLKCLWNASQEFGNLFLWQSERWAIQVTYSPYPADTWRNNNVIITQNDVATSFWRNDDVIITSRVSWVCGHES